MRTAADDERAELLRHRRKTKMSTITNVLKSDLTPTQKVVATLLLMRLGPYSHYEICWPSCETIAKDANVTRRQAVRCVATLTGIGLFKKITTTSEKLNCLCQKRYDWDPDWQDRGLALNVYRLNWRHPLCVAEGDGKAASARAGISDAGVTNEPVTSDKDDTPLVTPVTPGLVTPVSPKPLKDKVPSLNPVEARDFVYKEAPAEEAPDAIIIQLLERTQALAGWETPRAVVDHGLKGWTRLARTFQNEILPHLPLIRPGRSYPNYFINIATDLFAGFDTPGWHHWLSDKFKGRLIGYLKRVKSQLQNWRPATLDDIRVNLASNPD
jgi:hypothetical protein